MLETILKTDSNTNCKFYIKHFNEYQDKQPINEKMNFKEKPSNSYRFLVFNLKFPKLIL